MPLGCMLIRQELFEEVRRAEGNQLQNGREELARMLAKSASRLSLRGAKNMR